VAGDAALAHRRVLPQVRSALVGVAARAALVDVRAGTEQSEVLAPMRVVARGTRHGAFAHRHVREAVRPVHPVAMAGAPQLPLVLSLDLRRPSRRVDAVTRRAAQGALIVLAAVPERMRGAVVTRGARRAHFRRPRRSEIPDERGVAAVGVRLAGPVTALAAQ